MPQKKYAIIVAGGSGTRLGSNLPKQFMPLGLQPLLLFSLQAFHHCGAEIILVLPEIHIATWQKILQEKQINIPHKIVAGGKERFHSVKNALDSIKTADGVVAIHDAARPFVSTILITSIFEQADIFGGAVPLLPVKESIRKKTGGNTYRSEDRSLYFTVQTPQAFNLNLLKEAYLQVYSPLFTDDASVFEKAGFTVGFVPGEEHNFKITTPQDFAYAQYLVENKQLSSK
ncbi:MAG: 2-C-methyl-D-erythritol 4-phosphate cytidylyltransferase [Bacteroidia bacterium]